MPVGVADAGVFHMAQVHVTSMSRARAGDQMPAFTCSTAMRRAAQGALGAAGLEQVEDSVLHGEFELLHVAELPFEDLGHGFEAGQYMGQGCSQTRGVGCRMLPRDHVLALAVEAEVQVQPVLAAGRIAAEADAGTGGTPALPKTMRWTVTAVPILRRCGACAGIRWPGAHPRVEHRFGGPLQLRQRVLGKGAAALASKISR
jgi:hypothetical protein